MARTVMSRSQRIWQDRRMPGTAFWISLSFSATVITSGSPEMNSTRQVVQRALPPQACSWSTCASCSSASTRRLPSSTSTVSNPSTVSFGISYLDPLVALDLALVVRIIPGFAFVTTAPSRTTNTPLTRTYGMPTGYACGAANVAASATVFGSKTTRSAA